MKRFLFCLTTGMDGFLPDTQQYVDAACAVDAYDAIVDAIREFKAAEDLAVSESAWKPFFERGCAAPDASMWSFNLAVDDDGICLSLQGMTEEEFNRESAE